jgi:UDP-glucuronate 4-epimerase
MGLERRVLVTGTAGFIGYHVAKRFLDSGWTVLGVDSFTDYYDVSLKRARVDVLLRYDNFRQLEVQLQDKRDLEPKVINFSPDVIIHLAAQAGVRYSIENPRSYVDSNLIGTFNILELSRSLGIKHLLLASTSSAYGANKKMPFKETDNCSTPMSFYAATKQANEAMSHSYSHLYNIPTTVFRFFTVYGPWGRPDMALFKFVKAIGDGEPIDIFNHGEMKRDFTYIDDLAKSIQLLTDVVPFQVQDRGERTISEIDSISDVAPWRVVNIGNANTIKLMDFVDAIEEKIGLTAKKNFMNMQPGDVPETFADNKLLKSLIKFSPSTPVSKGVSEFVDWYIDYYGELSE